jgi:putative ABC transport system ATP-binding protein
MTSSAVQITDLRFRWRVDLPEVLHIPVLQVAQGERVFIQGASGSGKSTLLSLLAGVNPPGAGEVVILGQLLNRLNAAQRDRFRADHIGFVFQLFNLIPYLSVLENVTLPCRFSAQRRSRVGHAQQEALRLLRHLHLSDELIHRPVTELSVGQQQRVATARALIGAPELLIADEPTSALDTDTREAFIRLLFQECESAGSTLLFVSHDRQLQRLFERQIVLDDINLAEVT